MAKIGDTIAAIATPLSPSAIGIVRLSGPDARRIGEEISRVTLRNWSVSHAWISDPSTGDLIDEALLTYMASPKSYTGEDTVEISAHGSVPVLKRILSLLAERGARVADPGEFTRRAYLNGKLDLLQSEGILSLIEAKTLQLANASLGQMKGEMSDRFNEIVSGLKDILAEIEAVVDYPEDVGGAPKLWAANLSSYRGGIANLLSSSDRTQIARSGCKIVLYGPPNSGKSSLLNALLMKDRAIVSEIPGTTRDAIVESISIKGIPCEVTDTAGIRSSSDAIEIEGIRRSRDAIKASDIGVLVVDGSTNFYSDIRKYIGIVESVRSLLVVNKSDLMDLSDINRIHESDGNGAIVISAKYAQGIAVLVDKIYLSLVQGALTQSDDFSFFEEGQLSLLRTSYESITDVEDEISSGLMVEAAIDLKLAIQNLTSISGSDLSEDTIGRMFSRFCLGK